MIKTEPFEKYASQYEDWFEKNPFVYQSELRAIKEMLSGKGKGLEIGVGSGRFALPLNIRTGIEPAEKMRRIAQKRGIQVIGSQAEALPFHDSQFDFALMVTTICFLDDIDLAFKEVFRVTKSGGQFVIGFINKTSAIGKHYLKHKNESVFYKTAIFYSVKDVVFQLEKSGFKNFNFAQTIFKPLKEITTIEPIKKGYSEGSFVVIRGIKHP
ncbi:class I SAM-dependent methyltransferase [bacterium]|nr:class I SAM-dependent methyltransferase [bacterium]